MKIWPIPEWLVVISFPRLDLCECVPLAVCVCCVVLFSAVFLLVCALLKDFGDIRNVSWWYIIRTLWLSEMADWRMLSISNEIVFFHTNANMHTHTHTERAHRKRERERELIHITIETKRKVKARRKKMRRERIASIQEHGKLL